MQRRHLLTAAASASAALLTPGCGQAPAPALEFAFAGIDMERGHALRDLLAKGPLPAPAVVRSDERRVGNECVSKCRPGWLPNHKKKNNTSKTEKPTHRT